MATCAAKILSDNNMEDKIQLIYKRSNMLTVGENGDLKQRANILVTEVFDTELIGEGALSTFRHAQQYLLEVLKHTFKVIIDCINLSIFILGRLHRRPQQRYSLGTSDPKFTGPIVEQSGFPQRPRQRRCAIKRPLSLEILFWRSSCPRYSTFVFTLHDVHSFTTASAYFQVKFS